MDPLKLVNTTGDAVFATDKTGRIVAWNTGAELLLGHTSENVVGRNCFEVLCGIDVFRNPYCSEHCVLLESALRGVPLRRFEMNVKTPGKKYVAVTISTMRVANSDPQGIHIVHLMHPADEDTWNVTESGQRPIPSAERLPALTARESQMLRLISEGHSINELAYKLDLGATTIRTHLRNVRGKFDVRTTLEAVCVALRGGLI